MAAAAQLSSNYPPSTPAHPAMQRQRFLSSTPHASMADATPGERTSGTVGDSPLPPAPVSTFLAGTDTDHDARASLGQTVQRTEIKRIVSNQRYSISRATRETSAISDEDSPGIGRRALMTDSRLDEFQVPRASAIFQTTKPRHTNVTSSPILSSDIDSIGQDHIQSRGAGVARVNSSGFSRSRGSTHAPPPVSSSIFTNTPGYSAVARSSSYGVANSAVSVAAREEAKTTLPARTSLGAISNIPFDQRLSSLQDSYKRRTSGTPPLSIRRLPQDFENYEPDDYNQDSLPPVPIPSSSSLGIDTPPYRAQTRVDSRNGFSRAEIDQDRGGAEPVSTSYSRPPSDERALGLGEKRRRSSVEVRMADTNLNHDDVERLGSAEPETDFYADGERYSPPARQMMGSSSPDGMGAVSAAAYHTPAMAGRALRSSLTAAANVPKSTGRSLRKLPRSSNHHPPARRVLRRYSDDEDEDLDDAKGDDANKQNTDSNGHASPDSVDAIHQPGTSSEGSRSGSYNGSAEKNDPRNRDFDPNHNPPSPRFLPYGYDPEEAKIRAEIMERASLVRSPSPKLMYQDEVEMDSYQDQILAPPPNKKEHHPNAAAIRRGAPGAGVGVGMVGANIPLASHQYATIDNKESTAAAAAAAQKRKPGAASNALQEILAAKIPPASLSSNNGVRRTLPPSSIDMPMNPARNGIGPSFHANHVGGKPLAMASSSSSSYSAAPPALNMQVAIPEEGEDIEEEISRQFSDCRPELILAEASRQAQHPLANNANLMELIKGPPRATAMQGFKYRKVKKAGRGGFSIVWVVRGPLYEPSRNPETPNELEEVPEDRQAFFALKQVSLKEVESEQNRIELISEANTLRTLASLEGSEKYLLRYFGHRVSNDKLKILLELGDGDFNGILATQSFLPKDRIAHYWREMLEAVQFIHDANLVHADLKPANFLMVKNRIKLIDFGIAQNIPKGTVHISRDAIIGTPNYMAPEAIKIAKAKGRRVYKAGKCSDVWSLGCILYQMIWGRPPFDKLPSDRKLEGIIDPNHKIAYPASRDPRYPDNRDVDDDMMHCVMSALKYRVEERATIPQLLQHPFLRPPPSSPSTSSETILPDPNETVTISRQKLRNLVARLRILALQNEITEDNVVERADLLFTNLCQAQQQ